MEAFCGINNHMHNTESFIQRGGGGGGGGGANITDIEI